MKIKGFYVKYHTCSGDMMNCTMEVPHHEGHTHNISPTTSFFSMLVFFWFLPMAQIPVVDNGQSHNMEAKRIYMPPEQDAKGLLEMHIVI